MERSLWEIEGKLNIGVCGMGITTMCVSSTGIFVVLLASLVLLRMMLAVDDEPVPPAAERNLGRMIKSSRLAAAGAAPDYASGGPHRRPPLSASAGARTLEGRACTASACSAPENAADLGDLDVQWPRRESSCESTPEPTS